MKSRSLAVALLLASACTPERPPSPTAPPAAPSPSQAATPRASIKVSSLLSIPPAGPSGGPWSFPSGRNEFDLRVSLDGQGSARVTLRLTDARGRVVHSDEQNHEVAGPLELTFPGVTLPRDGSYTLALEVTAPGVRQASSVTIRRGS